VGLWRWSITRFNHLPRDDVSTARTYACATARPAIAFGIHAQLFCSKVSDTHGGLHVHTDAARSFQRRGRTSLRACVYR